MVGIIMLGFLGMGFDFSERGSGSGRCPDCRGVADWCGFFYFLGFGVVRGLWCGWVLSFASLAFADRSGSVRPDL